MMFPVTIASFWPKSWWYLVITGGKYSPFVQNSWKYIVTSFVFTVFFTWFYTQVTFKPDEIAENMHKSSGFVPGIRPGEQTARYVERILGKISLLWGVFAAVIAVTPTIIQSFTTFQGLNFTGTSLLIMVGVAYESMKAIQSQLVMRHYEGFLS
jgi:preprotein translocase subunit SecY